MSNPVLNTLRQELSEKNARLVAVSKTKPAEAIAALYELGQRDFGENRAQEMAAKHEALPPDIRWHLIGTLQTNKVKYIAPFVHLIHSVDSLHLLQEIDRQAARCGRTIDCLLQIKIASEETKQGLSPEEACALLASAECRALRHVRLTGLMGMASFTDDEDQVRSEFRLLKTVFDQLRQAFFADRPDFETLSMGMSGDYRLALEEGSNMVRVGSLLFGER
jgi:pyridoxal phosphate enzyme (YggS family)